MDWATATPIVASIISISTFVYAALSQRQTRVDLHHKAEAEYVEKLSRRTAEAESLLHACRSESSDFRARILALEDDIRALKIKMFVAEESHREEMMLFRHLATISNAPPGGLT